MVFLCQIFKKKLLLLRVLLEYFSWAVTSELLETTTDPTAKAGLEEFTKWQLMLTALLVQLHSPLSSHKM
jgi:hypothetical protein